MRAVLSRRVRGVLPHFLLLLVASAPAWGASKPLFSEGTSPAIIDPVKTEVRARLQTLGGWNVRMNSANTGVVIEAFDFTPKKLEPFFFHFDGDDSYGAALIGYQLRRFSSSQGSKRKISISCRTTRTMRCRSRAISFRSMHPTAPPSRNIGRSRVPVTE